MGHNRHHGLDGQIPKLANPIADLAFDERWPRVDRNALARLNLCVAWLEVFDDRGEFGLAHVQNAPCRGQAESWNGRYAHISAALTGQVPISPWCQGKIE